MVQLLFAVLAITLVAIAITAGMSSINFDTAKSQLTAQMASSGFSAWEQAFSTYRVVNGAYPDGLANLGSYLAGPRNSLPKAPEGFIWSYGSDGDGAFICLSGQSNSASDYDGLGRLSSSSSKISTLPADAISIGSVCGSSGDSAVGQPLAVTYRLTY